MNSRGAALSILIFLSSIGLIVWSSQNSQNIQSLSFKFSPVNCPTSPTFRAGYQKDDKGIIAVGEGFRLQGVSWLQADICESGTLLLNADGELANGESPQLQIRLNEKLLAVENFDKSRTIEIFVPQAGLLTLAYFNDYYKSEFRSAVIRSPTLSDSNCNHLSINIPKENGGVWNDTLRTATLISAVPMTIIPCASGTLMLRIAGIPAGSSFPLVTFQQKNKTIKTIRTTSKEMETILPVSADVLKVFIINPYFNEVADRNLNVRSLLFKPTLKNDGR